MNIYLNSHAPSSQHHYNRYVKFVEYYQANPKSTDTLHHVLPRSMGGSDHSDNLVSLSHRAHLIAHRLLWAAYRNQEMTSALWFMSHITKGKKYFKVTSRQYQLLRDDKSNFQKIVGKKVMIDIWENNRPDMIQRLVDSWTEERRESVTGDNNVSKRDNSRKKISDKLSGRKMVHSEIDGEIVTKRVTPKEFDEYVSLGWSVGHGAGNNPPRMVGKNHPRVKEYTMTDPTGIQYIVDISLREFCKNHGISDSPFRKINFSGTVTRGPAIGWSIRSLEPKE